MTFDTRTLVLVTRRLLQLSGNPPLFHEHITPRTIAIRFERIKRWMGPYAGAVVSDYLPGYGLPPAGWRKWRRAAGYTMAREEPDHRSVSV